MKVDRLGVSGLDIGVITDKGKVRETNEDNVLIEGWPDGSAVLLVLADGMGGQSGGRIASQVVVESFRRLLNSTLPTTHFERYERLLCGFCEAEDAIRRRASEDVGLLNMASTAIAAIITPAECLHLYAGDCRMYHYAGGSSPYITRDHSVLRVLVETGVVTPDEMSDHPMRSVVTSSLGAGPTSRLNVDPKWREAGDEQPSIRSLSFGDVLLFCTDGLSSEVNDDHLASIVAEHPRDPDALARACFDAAMDRGGRDNITVAVVEIAGLFGAAAQSRTDVPLHNLECPEDLGASANSRPEQVTLSCELASEGQNAVEASDPPVSDQTAG